MHNLCYRRARPRHWRIVPFDLVRSLIEPRQVGQAIAVHGNTATVRWDDNVWLARININNLERIGWRT